MTDEMKSKLSAAGREDLIETHELIKSGYAGVNKNGTIVDRRIESDATPIQENPMFNTPKPKKL